MGCSEGLDAFTFFFKKQSWALRLPPDLSPRRFFVGRLGQARAVYIFGNSISPPRLYPRTTVVVHHLIVKVSGLELNHTAAWWSHRPPRRSSARAVKFARVLVPPVASLRTFETLPVRRSELAAIEKNQPEVIDNVPV